MKLYAYHLERHTHLKSANMLGVARPNGGWTNDTFSSFGVPIDQYIQRLRNAGFAKYGTDPYLWVHVIDLTKTNIKDIKNTLITSCSYQFEFMLNNTELYDAGIDDYLAQRNQFLRDNDMYGLPIEQFIRSTKVQNEFKLTYRRINETIKGNGPYAEFINKNQYASIIPHFIPTITAPIEVTDHYHLNIKTGRML